ncbi:hypothetical protein LguiA_007757 [Lonicera macranthoides]
MCAFVRFVFLNIEKVTIKSTENEDVFQCVQDMKPQMSKLFITCVFLNISLY